MEDAWPQHLLASNHPTREWRSRPEGAWEAIRHHYLAGVGARELCDRFGVALSTLRLKAKEGGWRRTDQADDDPWSAKSDPCADSASSDDESWADLADSARFRLRRAIASGRAAEAASWLRVHERLRALVIAEAVTAPEPPEVAPDPIEAVEALASQIETIAGRAARATGDADIDALQAEVEALEARAAALTVRRRSRVDPAGPVLDSLDSLDPVFSDPVDPAPPPDRQAGREALLRTRERRLGLGLGVSDLDQALAALERTAPRDGLSP